MFLQRPMYFLFSVENSHSNAHFSTLIQLSFSFYQDMTVEKKTHPDSHLSTLIFLMSIISGMIMKSNFYLQSSHGQ